MPRRTRIPDLSQRCPACFFRPEDCLCPACLPPVETRTRLLVLRHVSERLRPTNTARWAALALAGARLLDYGARDALLDEAPLAEPGTCVLWPGGAPLAEPPRQVVVVDASWSQARRMLQRIPALQSLPRLSLPGPPPGSLRLREPPVAGGMSTIEAIARALDLLGEPDAAARLDRIHALSVERGLRLRMGPDYARLARAG
ncbi:DTW domain-containing protein [Anaeromyxobacter paludicola]|uniref:tRNA-uridine aminocarboxypropyltransferase n=1 Tax=Anaeromyxobacter paludicola TaxID=2918171 RepID=A0ABN6N414_9BACT|nr:tRNA-uridine aminocarboxypropyltransferase [Anaeromyxobacter paludicola]BDG07922.1 DTW domain-containing protein [Anaeromyxobacter paludicola]